MKIAVTGARGFLGKYLVNELVNAGHQVRAWSRTPPSGETPNGEAVTWIRGSLDDADSIDQLTAGADVILHSALFRTGSSFIDTAADPIRFYQTNVIGTHRLIESAVTAGVRRMVSISSGAVHDRIVPGRPLDETHPLWPGSLYGAAKASIETLVHAYGLSGALNICSLRPTAIYGLADPAQESKWYDIIADVQSGKDVNVAGGSKEVHAADVATAARILIETDKSVAGETYNCTDRMISRHEVATITKQLTGSPSQISGQPKQAANTMDTAKIRNLGATFGGTQKLTATIAEIIASI